MIKRFSLYFFLFIISFAIRAGEYPKVILRGDYPDPSILRDGEDYYMTHSPFYYSPGFLIWHSKDLVNWEPVCRAIPEYTGSAMAPDLIKHKGRFYLYYPAAGTNWVSCADDIKGPWSKPVDLKIAGIDPGHVVGEDGKRYLFLSDGNRAMPMVQLADDGLSVVGKSKTVYAGWQFPKNWKTEGLWLESPKLTKLGEYYYLTTAEGGTAGPPTSHMVVSARSKSIFGPWENSPYNPVVHTYSANENWWSKGHGTLVDDINGNWYIVYHAYANGYYTLGRQTLMEPVEWTKDGWFKTKSTATPVAPEDKKVKKGMELSDDFSSKEIGLQWTFRKEYAPEKISLQNHTLLMEGKGYSPQNARLLLTTAADKNYEIQVAVSLAKQGSGGLMLYYNEKAYAGVVSDGKRFVVYKSAKDSVVISNTIGNNFLLKIHNRGNNVDMAVSKDGKAWKPLLQYLDVSMMHHNNYGGFYALRPALVALGKGKTAFKDFRYKNAVPQEKDMGAYLMVFHKDDTHSLHMAISADGYSFTALNDGKPVIAGDTIAGQKGIRDPHIYRGPDGAFYLAMTDLHIFAQKAGYRNTEWERDGRKYAWGNNRALVLMKSWDLINWKRKNLYLDSLSAAFSEIGCAWAPEVTYDEKKGKLMIYFTMRYRNEPNKLYYAYVNDAFDKLETMPQQLFVYPDETRSAIDADITKVGDKYRMFYVAHDGTPGIKQAVSDKPNGDFIYDPRYYDFEDKSCEAPNVWKRIGENKWVLMYDCYGIDKHNFGFAETSDFINFTNLGHFNGGVMKATNFSSPKHGAVIHLTKEEADKLAKYWNLKM
jgi:Beta-xylosidase